MVKTNINVLNHLYYNNISELTNLAGNGSQKIDYNFFFNLCSGTISNSGIKDSIVKNHSKPFIISSSNKGKDIGGKLALIDLCIQLKSNASYYIFLHDKQSPHTTLGETWKKKLFRIIEPANINRIIELFEKNKNIGIIAAEEFIVNEYDKKNDCFTCSSNSILKELIISYSLNLNNYDFVGGGMFWIRAEIVHSFFKKYSPLDIRETLETGNVLDHEYGTKTHAWERVLSWIAIDQGYYIKGI